MDGAGGGNARAWGNLRVDEFGAEGWDGWGVGELGGW